MRRRHPGSRGGRPRPLLSACLIVRDEAAMLPECLASLAGVADEVVVVDTGSADGTQEIARRAGARVAEVPWGDDFAAARNAALERARGRWILQIDADERLTGPGGVPVDAATLRGFLGAPPEGVLHHDALQLRLRNPLPGGRWDIVPVPRLFLRRPGLRYRGRIHETLFPHDRPHRVCLLEGVELFHLGYTPEAQVGRDKHGRNLRLCELDAAERPEDPTIHYYYGYELARAGRTEEAIAHLRRAWDGMPDWMAGSGLWWLTVIRCCELMNGSGRAAEVLARLDPVLARYPAVAHLHFLRGEALRYLGRPVEALGCLQAALALPPAGVDWEPWNTKAYCWNAIGLILEAGGRPDGAAAAYRQSLALGPTQCAQIRLGALLGASPAAGA